jgi:hypothetical protein
MGLALLVLIAIESDINDPRSETRNIIRKVSNSLHRILLQAFII